MDCPWVLTGSRSDKASYKNDLSLAGQNGVLPFTSTKPLLKKPWMDFFNIMIAQAQYA